MAEQELYKREALPWVGLPLPDSTPVAKQHWCCSAVFLLWLNFRVSGVGVGLETGLEIDLDDYAQLETRLIA